MFRSKLAHDVVVVEGTLDTLLDHGVFDLLVDIDNILNFGNDFTESPSDKGCSDFQVF